MTNKIDIYDAKGAVTGEYAVKTEWLEVETKGQQAMHDCIVAFLAGERAGTACTKTRSEVRGGGAKPWRQKGTGRARSGSTRSPVFRGGGVIFGPKPRSFAKKVNKKVRQLALRRAFTDRYNDQAIKILDTLPEMKTVKEAQTLLKALKAENKTLLIVNDFTEELLRATDNMQNVLVARAVSVNVYLLVYFDNVIFTKTAIDEFVGRFGKGA